MIGAYRLLGLLLLLAGCAQQMAVQTSPTLLPPVVNDAGGAMSKADVAREVARLRAALMHEVPKASIDAVGEPWIDRAMTTVERAGLKITGAQLLVVVDRNPAVQQLRIVLAQSGSGWQVIGGSKVSTGQAGRKGYFITPVGVFEHNDGILDYRALGTFNENHIRGLGLKGMRVWDFGWQVAERGWRPDRDPAEIRLLMHATDPDYLEQRLGRPASQGCVRIPAAMNRFLDVHGVLDADYERAARDDRRFNAILLPDREPTPLAGNLLVVIDSSQTG